MSAVRCHPGFAEWAGIPSSIASDVLSRFSAMSGAIRSLTGVGVVGPAHTLRTMPGDNRSIHAELQHVAEGSVLVVDAGGYEDRAVWGEVLTVAAEVRGVVGIVVDGSVRDLEPMRERGFPVYGRGANPSGPHKAGGGVARGIVSCGGVAVDQGDLVIGDADGVTVVPRRSVATTHAAAVARMEAEKDWIRRITEGVPSTVVLGLEEVTHA
jgi:regulator of RNase E activity RraA